MNGMVRRILGFTDIGEFARCAFTEAMTQEGRVSRWREDDSCPGQ